MFDALTRFRRALGARLDGMITKVENHEALVASAVRELEVTLARAEREQARAMGALERLRGSLAEERDSALSWRERSVREPDQARGVECLRRCKRAERHAEELALRLLEHEAAEARLRARAALLLQKLVEFREHEAWLRARQSETEEHTGARSSGAKTAADLAPLLRRWETQLRETELASASLPQTLETEDPEPRDAAEEAALVRELRELKERTR